MEGRRFQAVLALGGSALALLALALSAARVLNQFALAPDRVVPETDLKERA